MNYLPLDKPGEYLAKITATFWDNESNLWVGVMRHAGVRISFENSPVEAHGKKLSAGQEMVDRGETHSEGFEAERMELVLSNI